MGGGRPEVHEDEELVLEVHPHGRVLVGPGLALVVLVPLSTYLVASVPDGASAPWVRSGVAVLAVLALLRWCVLPFLRWSGTAYVVTDQRVLVRSGVVSRRQEEILLSHLDDVRLEQGPVDRLLGCGTLVLGPEDGEEPMTLRDVPGVARVHGEVCGLAEDAADGTPEEGGTGSHPVGDRRRRWWW